MYLVKTPRWIRAFFQHLVWKFPATEKNIYLTFDDGPIPEVTPWVLEILKTYDAKATFFCVGENVKKHNSIYKTIIEEGHAVGNHTYHHLNGWNTRNSQYFENILQCEDWIDSTLFRPPYGKMKPLQVLELLKKYRIIMWDVLSGDFDQNLTKEKCLHNVLQNSSAGSIIVFHDSLKAEEHLRYVLPKVLAHFHAQGYRFKKIEP